MNVTDPQPSPAEAPPAGRPPGLLKRLYREEREAWRGHYRRYFKYAARSLGLGFVAGFLYFVLWPAQEKKALALVVQALKDIPLEASPPILALTLFYHNARASVVAVAAGAVPFLFLPILDPLLNGAVLGLLVSIARHQHLDVPRLVVTQILPHGVFELTAVLYATSLGLYLSAGMGKKAAAAWRVRMDRKKTGTCTAFDSPSDPSAAGDPVDRFTEPVAASLIRNVVRSFVLVVLPLLLVAAVVEAFVTPHLR
jgi:stage II sporulation protein M